MNQASPIGSVGLGKCARSRPKARGSTPFPGVQRNCSISTVPVSKRGAHHNRLSTPIGKPAAVRYIQLDDDNGCMIFGQPGRPAICASLQPSREMCGDTRAQAMLFLTDLDRLTS
jgi:hypothetical protein